MPVTISRYNVDWLAEQVTPRARERLTVIHCGVDLPSLPFQDEGRARGSRSSPSVGSIRSRDSTSSSTRWPSSNGRGAASAARSSARGRCAASSRPHRSSGALRAGGVGRRAPPGEVRAALRAATIFTLPSLIAPSGNRDGIPVSLMEAMAAGAPVVSTRVSGIPELIEDEREGLLVAPRGFAGAGRGARAIARRRRASSTAGGGGAREDRTGVRRRARGEQAVRVVRSCSRPRLIRPSVRARSGSQRGRGRARCACSWCWRATSPRGAAAARSRRCARWRCTSCGSGSRWPS